MTIAEYAILSVLIAAVVVSLGLAFSEREFWFFSPSLLLCLDGATAAGSGGRALLGRMYADRGLD
jgi:hypothetical protein